jgi:hypothetical protein
MARHYEASTTATDTDPRTRNRRPKAPVVVETGVDPVTFRFSGGRSAN